MNEFLEACGATSALQIAVEASGNAAREVHTFDLPFVIIGRSREADLRLEHPEVSERHAYLQCIDGHLLFLDLGSRVGIHQAGKRRRIGLVEREPATRIGPYRLRAISIDSQDPNDYDADEHDVADLAESFMARSKASDLGDPLVLELAHRSTRHTRIEIQGGVALVGSGADCTVRLIDPSVSSLHCSLVQTAAGTWLVDLLGKGGIKVNGQAVNHARLYEGDEAQVGASSFVVKALPAPAREANRLGFATSGTRHPIATYEPEPAIDQPPPASASPIAFDEPPAFSNPSPAVPVMNALEALPEPVTALAPAAKPSELVAQTANQLHASRLSTLEAAEIVDRVVTPLLEQLGTMRQQMLEEFHQARVMMFETMTTLQQEQSAAFNTELDQLRQLTKEIDTIRNGINQDRESQATRLNAEVSQVHLYPTIDAEPVPMPIALPFLPAPLDVIPTAHVTSSTNGHLNGNGNGNGHAHTQEIYRGSGRPHDEQIHAVLCDRISRLKVEQQTVWQRLMGIFPGAVTGKPSA